MSSSYDHYYTPAGPAHRHPPPRAMGAPMYAPAPPPDAYLAQPVQGPNGQRMFARRVHGSTVLEPFDAKKHERFEAKRKANPKIKHKEYSGYAVHGDQVVYIPKKKRGQYRVLHENQRKRGKAYHEDHKSGKHKQQHEERKKKRRVKHDILKTLADCCAYVSKEKKKEGEATPSHDWMEDTIKPFIQELSELEIQFTGSKPPTFDAKPAGLQWPKDLDAHAFPEVEGDTKAKWYADFGKVKRHLFSALKKLIGSAQQRHSEHAGELKQAEALAKKNGVTVPADVDNPLDYTFAAMIQKEGEMTLPRSKELQDKLIAKCILVIVLNHIDKDGKADDFEILNGIRDKFSAGVINGLLHNPERLKHIVKMARNSRRSMARSMAKKAAATAVPQASEAKVAPAAGSTPSLVSMLYHR